MNELYIETKLRQKILHQIKNIYVDVDNIEHIGIHIFGEFGNETKRGNPDGDVFIRLTYEDAKLLIRNIEKRII